MSFKVSAAPFHFWTPDVYDGAPTVFTSFMATIVKAASFIAFIRLFDEAFGSLQPKWQLWMAIITAATLFIGNITAVFQQSVKRMLAYSSIAQAGFMMLSLYAMNTDAKEGLLLYTAAYCLATIGIFAVLIKMSDYTFEGFNGFAKQPAITCSYYHDIFVIISRYSSYSWFSFQILYAESCFRYSSESLAGDLCCCDGCCKCILLFPR